MEGLEIILVIFILATASSFAFASDPSPLQDFCVADPEGSVSINGHRGSGVQGQPLLKFSAPNVCKGAALVTEDDFSFSGLHIRKNTSNSVGSAVTPVNVAQIPGLHTLGISMVRVDYAPNGGLNPPHTHPRASEILVVVEGKLRVGFVTSNPDNRLITKVLYPGDVFVFPEGLIHFQYNIGNTHAVAFAGLNSQNPGVITVANAVFGSNPSISAGVLAKAFKLDGKLVGNLQANF